LRTKLFFFFLLTLSFVKQAFGAEEVDAHFVPSTLSERDVVGGANDEFTPGWQKRLKTSLSGSLTENKKVIGQVDGVAANLGLKLNNVVNYNSKKHEWRNTVLLTLASLRTPVLPRMVKTDDVLGVDSIYLYHGDRYEWFGPFTRFAVDTALLNSYDVRAEKNSYLITDDDGATRREYTDRFLLTTPFSPAVLKESVGGFIQARRSQIVTLEFRLGLGARQSFAANQYALDDNDETAEIEVIQLRDEKEAGVEFTTTALGSSKDEKTSYKITYEVMVPYFSSVEKKKHASPWEKRSYEASATVSYHFVNWASLDYTTKLVRQPLVQKETQFSQSFLASINYSVGTIPETSETL
jgi:hypothetical protein